MKIKQTAILAIAMLIIGIAASCGEKYVIEGIGAEATGTRIKFVQSCSNCPSVLVKVGGQLVTGNNLVYNGTFPSVGYAAVPAGELNYEFVNATDASIVLAGKFTAADGKYYTVFLNDTLPTQTAFVTEDDVNAVKEDTMSRLRFVHGLTGRVKDTLEVVRKIDSRVVFSGVTFGKATPFGHLNQGNTPDSFFIRRVGTTSAYPGLGFVIATWSSGRTFTMYARGVTGKTGAPAPGMTFHTNR
jgi:Domain of unknown function (DUF4397)